MLKAKQTESLSRTLMDENEKPVATMTSQISAGKSLTMGIVLVDGASVSASDLTPEAEAFWRETMALAAQNGFPLDKEA